MMYIYQGMFVLCTSRPLFVARCPSFVIPTRIDCSVFLIPPFQNPPHLLLPNLSFPLTCASGPNTAILLRILGWTPFCRGYSPPSCRPPDCAISNGWFLISCHTPKNRTCYLLQRTAHPPCIPDAACWTWARVPSSTPPYRIRSQQTTGSPPISSIPGATPTRMFCRYRAHSPAP
jgi:hypothetical protein